MQTFQARMLCILRNILKIFFCFCFFLEIFLHICSTTTTTRTGHCSTYIYIYCILVVRRLQLGLVAAPRVPKLSQGEAPGNVAGGKLLKEKNM